MSVFRCWPRLACALWLAWACTAAAAAAPPRVGLVLGGGGARGAAHIGVLEVLEQLRVPVHCVAGTSMGALVAGAWAAGASPERMRGELTVVDWADLFQDSPAYRELSLRNKAITQRFLPGTEMGVSARGLTAPPGVVAGQKVKLFINQMVRADLGEPDVAQLALPLALIATDIGSGERVVFRSGSLTQAMRASMSVPGLMAPAEVDGRKLVDGGLVDNLPVAEVRALCQPDVVIAVNVGSPLLKAEEVSGLLSVTAQMVNILTEQNVTRSIASLHPRDILLQPDLDGISAADFERHADAAARGRAATQALAPRLAALALPPQAYAEWRRRFERGSRAAPRVDAIQIAGLHRVHDSAVRLQLRQRLGEVLDSTQLGQDLVRLYGHGDFAGVDYRLVERDGQNVLQIVPTEKSWGPDYLRLSLGLSTTLSQGASYSLRAAYHRTWINRWGGELLAVGELGHTNGLSVEWFQPLGAASPWFTEASTVYRRQRLDLFLDHDRIAEYVVERSTMALSAGLNLGPLGQLRLGWHGTQWYPTLSTGLPLLDSRHTRQQGLMASFEIDRLSRGFFPSDGWSLRASWVNHNGASVSYAKAGLELRNAWPLRSLVLASRVAVTASPRGQLPPHDAASLGGFLNLSAYSANQVAGDSATYAHLRAERVIGSLPLGLRGDLRLGAALEAGRVGRPWLSTRHDGWLHAATVYVGGATPLGPVFLGASHSFSGVSNVYLFIGTP
jgi:NTE family protein